MRGASGHDRAAHPEPAPGARSTTIASTSARDTYKPGLEDASARAHQPEMPTMRCILCNRLLAASAMPSRRHDPPRRNAGCRAYRLGDPAEVQQRNSLHSVWPVLGRVGALLSRLSAHRGAALPSRVPLRREVGGAVTALRPFLGSGFGTEQRRHGVSRNLTNPIFHALDGALMLRRVACLAPSAMLASAARS